jgi:hypothetical protein
MGSSLPEQDISASKMREPGAGSHTAAAMSLGVVASASIAAHTLLVQHILLPPFPRAAGRPLRCYLVTPGSDVQTAYIPKRRQQSLR